MKIIVCGCFGRMGEAVCRLAVESGIEVAAGIDLAGSRASFPTFCGIGEFTGKADAIIDFLPPTATDETIAILDFCAAKQVPLVLCSTGLPPEIEPAIANAAKSAAVLRSGNMSMGINLLAGLLKRISPVLTQAGFDIEIVERHHNQKLDAPSGTALMLADAANDALGGKMRYVNDRSGVHEKRNRDEIGLHAIRGGTIVGDHSVIFAGLDEVIEIHHSAQSREIFASGAIRAAQFLQGKPPGMYTMDEMLLGGGIGFS